MIALSHSPHVREAAVSTLKPCETPDLSQDAIENIGKAYKWPQK